MCSDGSFQFKIDNGMFQNVQHRGAPREFGGAAFANLIQMNVSNQREPDSLLLPIEKMKGRRWQLGEAVFDFDVLPNLNKERATRRTRRVPHLGEFAVFGFSRF